MDLLEIPGLSEACFGSISHVCYTSLPVYIKMDKVTCVRIEIYLVSRLEMVDDKINERVSSDN